MGTVSQIKDTLKREAKMPEALNVKNTGLRGEAVADTKISNTDGENGILIYRGYRIEDLAKNSTLEETAYLLLYDALPNDEALKDFRRKLVEAGELPSLVFDTLRKLPKTAQPMDVLQASIPILA